MRHSYLRYPTWNSGMHFTYILPVGSTLNVLLRIAGCPTPNALLNIVGCSTPNTLLCIAECPTLNALLRIAGCSTPNTSFFYKQHFY